MDKKDMQNSGNSINQERLQQNKMKRSDISKSQQRTQRPVNQSKQIEQLKLDSSQEFQSSKRLEKQNETSKFHSNDFQNGFMNQDQLDSNQIAQQQNLNETDQKISNMSQQMIKSLEMNQYKLKDYNERYKSPQQMNRYLNLLEDELQAQPYQLKDQFSPLLNPRNIEILSNPDNEINK